MKPAFQQYGIRLLAAMAAAGCLSAPAQETNRANPADFPAFRLITDRNIFDPNRRAARVGSSRQDRAAVDSFTLSGTLSFSNVLVAVFDGTKADYHKVLKAGDPIAGYALGAIGHDSVKLLSGTNHLELKVGMQLRRSEDGKWSVSESAGSYGATLAANSRRRSSDPREAASGRSPANPSRSSGEPEGQSNSNAVPDMAGGPPPGLPPEPPGLDGPPGAPPDAAGGNVDDPVARMMQRRLQETGVSPNENEN
jgi:hypothetical protein